MRRWTTVSGPRVLVAIALLAGGCTERVGPEPRGLAGPALALTASPIALDQVNGTFNERGTVLVKGFNPTNPHVGDAILATFFWIDPTLTHTNIITSVTDRLTNTEQTPVGNTYTLIEFVSDGDVSMATYLATNVQNFPDGVTDPVGDQILAVQANLALPVVDGGLLISAWTGVNAVSAQALGAHRSASGSGIGSTIADPGAIAVNAGALAYAVTLSNGVVDLATPTGFTTLITQSDLFMKGDGEYDAEFAVEDVAGSVDPQWTWSFTLPSTWLASVLALNPAPPPAGNLTVTTSTSGSNLPSGYTVTVDGTESQSIGVNSSVTFTNLSASNHGVALTGVPANCTVSESNTQTVTVPSGGTATITFTVTCTTPPGTLTVRTSTSGSNLPSGYTVTVDGSLSQAIGINSSVTFTNLSAGSHSVALTNVASNCTVSGSNPRAVTVPSGGTATTTFTVSCSGPGGGKMTGGGKLGGGRDFATFGFEARPTGGNFEWVQHCPDGANPGSATCAFGEFTFKGKISPGTYSAVPGQSNCRTWSGTGTAKVKDNAAANGTYAFTVNQACDNGEPGHGRDFIDVTIDGYHASGYLTGGNIQLHKGE